VPGWIDIDEDGDLDLYITNTFFENNFLYINHGGGFFTRNDTTAIARDGQHGSSPNWGDFDNDGDLDLFISNTNNPGDKDYLYRNEGNLIFTRLTNVPMANDAGPAAGSTWGDIDNDGDLDLIVAQGESFGARNNHIYLNHGQGEFERITDDPAVTDAGQSDGLSLIDWDGDGALELLVANRDRNSAAYENSTTGNWINIKLTGTTSNRSAIGTRIRVKAQINGQDIWQLRMISGNAGRRTGNGLHQHFGLSTASLIDTLLVEWPSGLVETYSSVALNQLLVLTEGAASAIDSPDKLSRQPDQYMLYQNYPNPFNPVTYLKFRIPNSGFVALTIYNVKGQVVKRPIGQVMSAGIYQYRFDGNDLASGIYYYQLVAGDFREVKKMILLR
jgi:hypothetical protein